jgi:hypothetical protein
LRSSLIGRFLALSLLGLLVLMVPWYFLAPYLAAPAIELAAGMLHYVYPGWVDGVQRSGTVATLITRVSIWVNYQGRMAMADMAPDVNFLKYGYGQVLLWAMLLASRPPRWALKLVIGSVALIPVQAVGLCFHWLKDIMIQGGDRAQQVTGIAGWQMEAVAFGYQFSFLVLTPLVPVLLWLLMNRHFMAHLWLEETLAQTLKAEVGNTERKQNPM